MDQAYMGPILAVTGLVLLLELLMGRHRGIYKKRDWLVIGLPAILNPVTTRAFAAMLIAAAAAWLMPGWKGALAEAPLLPSYLILLLVTEFSFYWVHRWAHEGARRGSPRQWLWKLHRTHHSAKFMNVIVTLRMNLFWSLVVPTGVILGFAIHLGLAWPATWVILTIYGWNLITHANFRWDDKIRSHPRWGHLFWCLEHVLVSPGIHHTHHGYGRDGATYRNFAVTFSFLDWMFGTLHIPQGRPRNYGLPGKEPHWAEEVFYPLVRIYRADSVAAHANGEKAFSPMRTETHL